MATTLNKRMYNLRRLSPLLLPAKKSNVTIIHGHPKFHLFRNTYSSSSIGHEKLIRDHVDVSLKLAKHVFSTQVKGNSNMVLSPLSINVILGMLANGAEGPTHDELLSFLKSKSTKDLNAFYSQIVRAVFKDSSHIGGPHLSVANGLWIDQTLSLKSSFKHLVDTVYKATSESLDFLKASEVAKQVNLWVKKETRGLIQDIVSANDIIRTKLILANALYFKGAWTKQFDVSFTRDQEFHLLNGNTIQVPFMSSFSYNMRRFVKAFNGFKVLRLPYKQGRDTSRSFSMYLFLPDAMDGLPSLMDKVCSESGFFERHLPNDEVKVGRFQIPKFKISFGFEASSVLKELGVVSPFNGGLTEMVDSLEDSHGYVSQILHKAFIEVNETGTEAAAVTCLMRGCMPGFDKRVDFVADHPFMFVIREDSSGVILFIGTIINPSSVN